MCHQSCINFVKRVLTKDDIEGRKIIEVGSLDINGSVSRYITSLKPQQYIGVDITPGPGVDEICDTNDLVTRYGPKSFDVVIATELMEHVNDWRKVINNFKDIIIPNGTILITTRSKGFGYHGFPSDYWRFEENDIKYIFSDFIIERLEKDSLIPGVFIKARKPLQCFPSLDLSKYAIYSIIVRRKIIRINKVFLMIFDVLRGIIRRILPLRLKLSIAKNIYDRNR